MARLAEGGKEEEKELEEVEEEEPLAKLEEGLEEEDEGGREREWLEVGRVVEEVG